jgi:hypothetical protein
MPAQLAIFRFDQSAQRAQQGRLASAIRSRHHERTPGSQFERNSRENRSLAAVDSQVVDDEW